MFMPRFFSMLYLRMTSTFVVPVVLATVFFARSA
ncbi:Uncharacterised protein [Mycobacterium tuberculosis]|nr:Uncharacterised protein [Mycobacterium tuberculosis]